MADFRTDYKDQLLDSSVNTKRKYDLVDGTGKVVAENVTFEDKTVYTQDGDTFGAAEVNKIHSELNGLNNSLGVDIKLIDGVPNWSERGADTWSPFSGNLDSEFIFASNIYTANRDYSNVTLFWYTADSGKVVSSPTFSYSGSGTATLLKAGLYSDQTTAYCMVTIKNMKAGETVSFRTSSGSYVGNISVVKTSALFNHKSFKAIKTNADSFPSDYKPVYTFESWATSLTIHTSVYGATNSTITVLVNGVEKATLNNLGDTPYLFINTISDLNIGDEITLKLSNFNWQQNYPYFIFVT